MTPAEVLDRLAKQNRADIYAGRRSLVAALNACGGRSFVFRRVDGRIRFESHNTDFGTHTATIVCQRLDAEEERRAEALLNSLP